MRRPPGVQELANPVQLLSAATRSHRSHRSPEQQFGMTMWFTVTVPGLGDGTQLSLGAWSACSGLEVTLTPEGPFDEGGNYTTPRYLPGKVGYSKVTLERAMTQDGTAKVRQWLEQQSRDWVAGTELKDPGPAVVTLFSGLGLNRVAVHSWTLQSAFPVSWTVPPFSSSGGGIAVEKLVLQHRGFLKPLERRSGQELRLIEVGVGRDLSFLYNPSKVALKKSREAATGRKKLAHKDDVIDSNSLSVTLSDLRIEGREKLAEAIPLLRDWVALKEDPQPGTGVAPTEPAEPLVCSVCKKTESSDADAEASGQPRVLQVSWGRAGGGMPEQVMLRSFDLTITRFTADGEPSRATVQLTLQEYAPSGAGARRSGASGGAPRAGQSDRPTGARPDDPLRNASGGRR